MYNSFRSERLQGDKSVWDPMIKRKLPTFSETAKLFKMQFDDKVVQLKEEKMSKFVVASRRRDYIDLPHYFGKHEFSVVPRSMFRQDGSLLLGCDKASVMHQIEELVGEKKENMETENLLPENLVPETSHRKVIILDGMAVVNQIKKTS